jgi:pimeloyl-ACP methyl ester carboxylesterase
MLLRQNHGERGVAMHLRLQKLNDDVHFLELKKNREVSAPDGAELLDVSGQFLGLGRSLTIPFPQWRARDRYRTVFFDEGEGRTLVFVHGLGGNATHWELMARELVPRYRVVGLDLVGFGWSQKPDVPYTVELLRDHLLDFLDMRRIRRATLIGHSLGGAVCLSAALENPAKVESLVTVCGAGLAPLPLWMRLGARVILHQNLLYFLFLQGFDIILDNVFVDHKENNEQIRWFRQASLRDAPGNPNLKDFARVSETLCRDVVQKDYSDRFSSLSIPVLTMLGDHDKLTSFPSVLRKLSGFRRIRTVVLNRCGHLPMIERPQETLFHLERFLNSPPL